MGLTGSPATATTPPAPGRAYAAPPNPAEQILGDELLMIGRSRGLVPSRFTRRHRSTYLFKVRTCRGVLMLIAQADASCGIITSRTGACRGMRSELEFACCFSRTIGQ